MKYIFYLCMGTIFIVPLILVVYGREFLLCVWNLEAFNYRKAFRDTKQVLKFLISFDSFKKAIMRHMQISEKINWNSLSDEAWKVRENAFLIGNVKVGAALLSEKGVIFSGCNVEHIYRSHDIHAEVNAIATMVAHGEKKFSTILIAADRDKFTPCGACMDWIMQHGGENCIVAYQNMPSGKIYKYTAKELMPHYPS